MLNKFNRLYQIIISLVILSGLLAIIYSITNRDAAKPEPSETTKPRMIHIIPEQYQDTELLLANFQKDLISLEEVIQILILYQNEGTFVPFFDADTYYDKYYIHKETYLKRKTQ